VKKKIKKVAPIVALAALMLTGCATNRVRFEAQRTPNLDTSGIQRIAVMPFETAGAHPNQQAVANELTAAVTERLTATGAFTLVSHITVTQARERGTDVSQYVDAMLVGRIIRHSADIRERSPVNTALRREADSLAAGIPNAIARSMALASNAAAWPAWNLEVDISFEYHLVRARDGSMIGPIFRSGNVSRGHDNRNALPAPSAITTTLINNQLRHFYRDVTPHTLVVTRTLETEPDTNLRPLMNDARAQVRAGNYVAAHRAYVAIWEDHGSVAAAINAAIISEVIGDIEDSIYFMEHVYVATLGNARVSQAVLQLNAELAEQRGVAEFEDMRTPAERVAEHATREVERVLSGEARLWIHNVATTGQNLANDVVDNMVSTFLYTGVTVVERQMIDLILAEQNLHLEGSVSDSDFVSIGNLAGANTIVSIDITGSGPARRLRVRVLDIETGAVRMQSGTGVAWRI
jgi:hypothetical protein